MVNRLILTPNIYTFDIYVWVYKCEEVDIDVYKELDQGRFNLNI